MAQIVVTLEEAMGSDLKVVQMARDSFGKTSKWAHVGWSLYEEEASLPEGATVISNTDDGDAVWGVLSPQDKNLIKMLARGVGEKEYVQTVSDIAEAGREGDWDRLKDLMWKWRNTPTHTAPFGHNFATFKFQAPVFVMRQIVKHKFLRLSELSMRYVRGMPEYFEPENWRGRADNIKQGSGEPLGEELQNSLQYHHEIAYTNDKSAYEQDLEAGLCPEQARMFLRLCHMTQGHMSGSMDAWASLCKLRLDDHAQVETRLFAEQVYDAMSKRFPVSWAALMEGVKR